MCRSSSYLVVGGMRRSSSQGQRPSQAVLLRNRGDFLKSTAHFETRLPKASPLSFGRCDRPCAARIGMDAVRSRCHDNRLVIADVDANPRLTTPVAQLNCWETRQANRGDGECHISRAILPGDRIRALQTERTDAFRGVATLEKNAFGEGREYVGDENACRTMTASAMLKELADATKFSEPKEVKLSLSRDISNVMVPAPHANVMMQRVGESVDPRGLTRPHSAGALKRPDAARTSTMNALATPSRPPKSAAAHGNATRRPISAAACRRSQNGRSASPGRVLMLSDLVVDERRVLVFGS